MTYKSLRPPQQTGARGHLPCRAPKVGLTHYVKVSEDKSPQQTDEEDICAPWIAGIRDEVEKSPSIIEAPCPTSPVSSDSSQRSDSDSDNASDSSSQTSNGEDNSDCLKGGPREGNLAASFRPSLPLPQYNVPIPPACLPIKELPSRRRWKNAEGSQPCQLKRDTELTDCFVTLLILFATRLVTAVWPLSACKPRNSTCFNGAGVLPLKVFIQETLRRSKTSYSTLQVALFYLVLLKEKIPLSDFTQEQPAQSRCKILQCGRRMFLSALMLASKYLQDRNYSTRAWSKISGLRNTEINENETTYLQEIDYKLHLPKESFDNWNKVVLALCKFADRKPFRVLDNPPRFVLERASRGQSGLSMVRSSNYILQSISESPWYLPGGIEYCTGVEYCTERWWQALVKDLSPDIVKDAAATDAFLEEKLPLHVVSDLTALSGTTLAGPSPPPEDADDVLRELQDMRGEVKVSEPIVKNGPNNMPTRPSLPNLPTPTGTPQIGGPLGVESTPKPVLRCAASMSALSNLKKQCLMSANLERCPPPQPQRPQSMVLPPIVSGTSCRWATPLSSAVSSPASMVSDVTTHTFRSRSSSISSTSSWSAVPPQNFTQAQTPSDLDFSSPLTRFSSATSEGPPEEPARTIRRCEKFVRPTTGLPFRPHVAQESPLKSSWSSLSRGAGEESLEVEAAETLVSLHSSREGRCTTSGDRQFQMKKTSHPSPALRGHKRALSGQNDPVQDHVSRLMRQSQNIKAEAIEDSILSTNCMLEDKQCQFPSAEWASIRKPVSTHFDSKRLALLPELPNMHIGAPALAATLLRQDQCNMIFPTISAI